MIVHVATLDILPEILIFYCHCYRRLPPVEYSVDIRVRVERIHECNIRNLRAEIPRTAQPQLELVAMGVQVTHRSTMSPTNSGFSSRHVSFHVPSRFPSTSRSAPRCG